MALHPRHLQAASGSTSGASECTPNEPRACHHSPTAPAVHTAEPAPNHESPSEGCLPPREGVGKPKSDRVGLCKEPSGGSQHVWQEGLCCGPGRLTPTSSRDLPASRQPVAFCVKKPAR